MGNHSQQQVERLEASLRGFTEAHPEASAAQFAAWAAGQRLLARQPALVLRLAGRLKDWPALIVELRAALGPEVAPAKAKNGASIFRPGKARGQTVEGAFAKRAQLAEGTRVGQFVLRQCIGRGGMGEVWEAFDESLRRAVALKFVLPEQVDLRALERFEREARAGGRLQHPNVVRTLAFGREGDLAWLAQELVEGSWTLKDFLDELRSADSVPRDYYPQVADLIAQVADGLQAAHAAGVIHRDIKPQNILIDPEDRPKLADFGLARVSDDPFLSVSGEVGGTFYYMSPEQVLAKRHKLDHRTDIFSLGVVFYELLSMRRPFEGDTTHQISQKILHLDPPEPSKVRSQCPRDLSVICGKALQKDPHRRYANMADLAADLRRYLANEPILAQPPGALLRLRLWMRRHPTPSVAIGVAGVALLVISGLLVQQVQTANALESSNLDLAAQTRRAEDGELEAQANAAAAQLARDEATRKANDIFSLSAQKNHDDLVAEAETLWPADPEMIPQYEDWLRRAQALIQGQPGDEARGIRQQLSLEQHRAKLAHLRQEALPLSAEQIQAEREAHPLYTDLQHKRARLLWRKRMLGQEAWPTEAEVEQELANEDLPTEAGELNALAWRLVDPAVPIYGQEVRAVLLARRALAAASEPERALIRNTLAWTLWKVGRMEEALAEEQIALSESGSDKVENAARLLKKLVDAWSGDALKKHRDGLQVFQDEIDPISALVEERRTYEFVHPEQAWWHGQLKQLVADLEAFQDPETGLMQAVVAEPFGWGIRRRYEFAQSITAQSLTDPEPAQRWLEAIAALQASPRYAGLAIEPQLGLVPIGMDPDSQLWEFAHLQTGEPAVRSADGRLVLTEETGLVLVLIPGGEFWMGTQDKPGAQNHDPLAEADEGPVHAVKLSPYFLSKYEMTQGQWQRIAGMNPSSIGPDQYSARWNRAGEDWNALHPVEEVSWLLCSKLTADLGLRLPTEAQWECAARGGTSSVFSSGDDVASLNGYANVSDAYGKQNLGDSWVEWSQEIDDGHSVHSPVGSFRANPFGLHDMYGNVWEWCYDGFDPVFYGKSKGKDPFSSPLGNEYCIDRGGSFNNTATYARSASRGAAPPEEEDGFRGLRPARTLWVSPAAIDAER